MITPIVAAATRFSAKLRDEIHLVALNDDLVGVVRETIQPARARCGCAPIRPLRSSGRTSDLPIHPSAWNRRSRNFACRGFSDVRLVGAA